VGGLQIGFGRVHVVTVFAAVDQDHLGRQGVQHAVDERRQQPIAGGSQESLRLCAASRFEVDAVQPQGQQHSVREFLGHGLHELGTAAPGQLRRIRKRPLPGSIKPELGRTVGLEVDGQALATALLHQPCTVAGLLGQRRPTGVVVPGQVAGRRVETHEVVLESLKAASLQIGERRLQPIAFPRFGVPDRFAAESDPLVVLRLDAEHDAVKGRGLFHVSPVLAKVGGGRDVPAQFDELLLVR